MSRVVLLISRPGPGDRASGDDDRLARTLDQLQEGGYTLVALVDPEAYLDALRMVLDGLADLIVVIHPQDFPIVQLAADLNGHRRARPMLRPMPGRRQEDAPGRRPRLVGVERPADECKPVERRPAILPGERRSQVIRRAG